MLIKNRNKLLAEEHASIKAKYEFIIGNYDYTSNIKKLSMDDMNNVTHTNKLVNESIDVLLGKILKFKNKV